jgi:phosphosulfolactate phosphohydrolase-like enzyme
MGAGNRLWKGDLSNDIRQAHVRLPCMNSGARVIRPLRCIAECLALYKTWGRLLVVAKRYGRMRTATSYTRAVRMYLR